MIDRNDQSRISTLNTSHRGLLEQFTSWRMELRFRHIFKDESEIRWQEQIFGTIFIDHKKYYKIRNEPVTYEYALQKYGLTTLHQRREVLTQKFAFETIKNPYH